MIPVVVVFFSKEDQRHYHWERVHLRLSTDVLPAQWWPYIIVRKVVAVKVTSACLFMKTNKCILIIDECPDDP